MRLIPGSRSPGAIPPAAALLALLALSACASGGGRVEQEEGAINAPMQAIEVEPREFLRAARGMFVVVDLDINRLSLMDGQDTLWSAPVGTGTGLRLMGDDGEWHFSTPPGVFQIQYKEEMPIWFLPDWYFIEKGQPIPPPNAPERRAPGQLGVAAVYLGEEIAIHGTDKPELLGQRVSHGCIRLENRFAQRLFHNVQVGTPVVITGGEHLDELEPAPSTDPGRPGGAKKPRDPFAGVTSAALLTRLERQLKSGEGDWVPVVSRLITRGLKDDAPALRGLLTLAGTARTETLNREYATFLADVFSRGALRTVVSLARIEEEARERAAIAIVEATIALHTAPVTEENPYWPTRRVPPGRLGPDGTAGWEALRAAEDAHREQASLANRERK